LAANITSRPARIVSGLAAPPRSSRRAMVVCPAAAAISSADQPSTAPKKAANAGKCCAVASSSADSCRMFRMERSAPAEAKISTDSRCPLCVAAWRGVEPDSPRAASRFTP
jgi:hypothetical protein